MKRVAAPTTRWREGSPGRFRGSGSGRLAIPLWVVIFSVSFLYSWLGPRAGSAPYWVVNGVLVAAAVMTWLITRRRRRGSV